MIETHDLRRTFRSRTGPVEAVAGIDHHLAHALDAPAADRRRGHRGWLRPAPRAQQGPRAHRLRRPSYAAA